MKAFDDLLEESVRRHGHLCPGQVIGVRMAMLGCRLLGIDDPHASHQRKKLLVFVEIDRCATDAIESVTGCRMGKRTLKFRDYGIMAATFLHLERGTAYRIVSREDSRERAAHYAPHVREKHSQQLEAYQRMTDEELFTIHRVAVDLRPWEMPGPPQRKVLCDRCGEVVRDGREIRRGRVTLCRPCAGEAYFRPLSGHHAQEFDAGEALS
jgi:formylmethanofuran dehydrogenase subunit E